jgi:formate hydrogenlyase transcriptional activator
VSIPPLRERPEDIPALTRHFTDKYAHRMKKQIDTIPEPVIDALVKYPWPGNVRELQNFIERAVILSQGSILEPPLAELIHLSRPSPAQPVTMKDAERAHILRTLERTNGQLAAAAALLGLPRSTLFYRIRRLGIAVPRIQKARK